MKRSMAKSIRAKQSSAYAAQATRMTSIVAINQLKSWPGVGGLSKDAQDAQAEKIMAAGWSRRRNPICSSCYVAKSNNGSCGCTD